MPQTDGGLAACAEPDAGDSWRVAMQAGDLARAWAISDAVLANRLRRRDQCWHWPRHEQFIWRGAPLAGRRVLVRCYHGLGDTIQFLRFLEPLRAIAAHVILWVQPELLTLARTARGSDEILPLHDGDAGVSYDVDIEIMELPHALRTTLSQLAHRVPYLHATSHARISTISSENVSVGIVWSAGDWDQRRSLDAAALATLVDRCPSVAFHNLQRGPARIDGTALGFRNAGSDDIAILASQVCELDLVVSVDTMLAHLAGALGIPVYVLLHSDCDWRWMKERSDSPWYPTARLFRQDRPGDWNAALASLATAVQAARAMTGRAVT